MDENAIAREIVDAAFQIHQHFGPGLLESVYEVVLAYELRERGLTVERQVPISIKYKTFRFDEAYRYDLLVGDIVIVEVKSIEEVLPVHKKQVITYLKLLDKRLGLLINFNTELIKQGITRLVNGLPD